MATFELKQNVEVVENDNNISFYDRYNPLNVNSDAPALVDDFKSLPPFDIKFDVLQRMYKQAGKLVYDYNPFHNLILDAPRELSKNGKEYYFKEGDIYDFDVDRSLFPVNLRNPLNLEIQPSYDGSVNVIAYDNLNNAVLVNSRFSVEELDTYRIIDRKGQNDTNLYEEKFLQNQIKLYKTSDVISQIHLDAVEQGGILPQGSYTIYFKYQDQDGNETDIMAESGIIHCFIGNDNDPTSVRGGMTYENTGKLIRLSISPIDKSYDYITLYYVHNTSDYSELTVQKQYKVLDKYVLNHNENVVSITLSGYETINEITLEEIIQEYNTVDRQRTMTQVQNRLFQANTTIDRSDYRDLEDLSLRFLTTVRSDVNIGNLNHLYQESDTITGLEYYNPLNLYSKLGYWDKELYRLGIVYISNNRLSPVFNIRGGQNINECILDHISTNYDYTNTIKYAGNPFASYTYYPLTKDGKRIYIPVDENKNVLNADGNISNENAAGIIHINHNQGPIRSDGIYPLGLQLSIDKETLLYLKSIGIDGFFFVRQKRIPTILFQGITQGYSTNQELPQLYTRFQGDPAHRVEVLPVSTKPKKGIKISAENANGDPIAPWTTNSTIYTLTNESDTFKKRFVKLSTKSEISSGTIFSPDLHLNSEKLSDLLVGTNLTLSLCKHQLLDYPLTYNANDERHFYNQNIKNLQVQVLKNCKVTIVNDSHPVKYSGSRRYRGQAGTANDVWRFESLSMTDTNTPEIPSPETAIRGMFSTYAGLEDVSDLSSGTYVDIHVPGYSVENLPNYFRVRKNSYQSYHAITDRYDLQTILNEIEDVSFWKTMQFRGDCFIGNYTQRVNRNFTDPELPINDKILGNTIQSNDDSSITSYSVWFASAQTNGIPFIEANYNLVNRIDANSVNLGHWLTFKVCSNVNHILRGIDRRDVVTYSLTGSNRSFYPHSKMSITSEQKLQESSVINAGHNVSITPKYHIINPDVPYLQDRFNNRIMFSDIHVNDSFRNGYRVFKGLNYKDYNLGHGSIIKILEWQNNILVVFEHGIGILPINENSVISGENAGDIYIRNLDVLPQTMKIISDTYGSQWQDSIVQSPRFVYGLDHVAKKVWRTNGEQLELISDFRIQSFLNEKITMNAREKTPTIGIRNIKSHYNAYKEDIMFTYYDVDSVVDEKKWNICFNEQLNKWVTRYDWEPEQSVSINNIYFTYDRESVEKISLLQSSYINSTNAKGIVISNYEISPTNSIELSVQGDILSKFYPKFHTTWLGAQLDGYDNALFRMIVSQENGLWKHKLVPINVNALRLSNKFLYSLRIKAELYKDSNYTEIYDELYDTVHLRLDRRLYSEIVLPGQTQSLREQYDTFYTTRFWKHGKAGIFFSEGEVKPTTWYNKTRVFEFECVVNEQPVLHKILANLIIISNNAEPDSIEYTVDNDVYTHLKKPKEIDPLSSEYKLNKLGELYNVTELTNNEIVTTITDTTIQLFQKIKNSLSVGRLKGNAHYKESYWFIDVAPLHLITKANLQKQQRIKDKQIKIRVRYSGNNLAVVTSLNSIFTQSYQ